MISFFNRAIKRLADIILSTVGILFFIPVWILLGILVKLDSPGPVFYIHKRVSRDGREFDCLKFRSMRADAHPNRLAESDDDDRITALGNFLRKSSLDETPQLINVLLGDMSIVGPRPALPVQVKHFNDEEMEKISVKPGLTGWAQLCYPYGASVEDAKQKLQYDLYYLKNHSFLLDLIILLQTVEVVLVGEGAR